MARHQHLLIRRLRELLASRMTTAGHLALPVTREQRGGCPPGVCSPRCIEARELMRLTESYLPVARTAPRPVKPLPRVVLVVPRKRQPAAQLKLLEVG